jgi:hypothetical protein
MVRWLFFDAFDALVSCSWVDGNRNLRCPTVTPRSPSRNVARGRAHGGCLHWLSFDFVAEPHASRMQLCCAACLLPGIDPRSQSWIERWEMKFFACRLPFLMHWIAFSRKSTVNSLEQHSLALPFIYRLNAYRDDTVPDSFFHFITHK